MMHTPLTFHMVNCDEQTVVWDEFIEKKSKSFDIRHIDFVQVRVPEIFGNFVQNRNFVSQTSFKMNFLMI